MDEFIKLLDENLDYVSHEIEEDTIIIQVKSNRKEVICPYCGQSSSKLHSYYERGFQDLPVMDKKSKILIKNRKLVCLNPNCDHTTFAEQFSFLPYKSKKSNRLLNKIIDISLSVSSVTAETILRDGVAQVSKSTICELLKKKYTPSK